MSWSKVSWILALGATIASGVSFANAVQKSQNEIPQSKASMIATAEKNTFEGLKAKFELGNTLATQAKNFEIAIGPKIDFRSDEFAASDVEALKWFELAEKQLSENPCEGKNEYCAYQPKAFTDRIKELKHRIASTIDAKQTLDSCGQGNCPSEYKNSYKTQKWNWTFSQGIRLLYGYGTNFNPDEAIQLFEVAATEGKHMPSAYMLAKMHGTGAGVPVAIEKSKKWTDLFIQYYESEKPKYAFAPIQALHDKIGGPWWNKPIPEIMGGLHSEWRLKTGAESSDPNVLYGKANAYFKSHDGKTGLFWLEKAITANHTQAKFHMYQLYKKSNPPFHNRTAEENKKDAATWRKIAAESGHPEANFDMFDALKTDPNQAAVALEHLKTAVNAGSSSAELEMARLMLGESNRYPLSKLVTGDREEGVKLLNKARLDRAFSGHGAAHDLYIKFTDPKLHAQLQAKSDADFQESVARSAKYYDPSIQNRVEKIAYHGPANEEELDFLCSNLKPELRSKKNNACDRGKATLAYQKSEADYKERRLKEASLVETTDFKPSHSDAAKASFNRSVRQSNEANLRRETKNREANQKSQRKQQLQRDRNIRRSN